MNLAETATILAKAAAIDGRDTSDVVLAAWAEVLEDIDYADADRALLVFRRDRPDDWLQPGHLVAISAPWRADRRRRLASVPPSMEQLEHVRNEILRTKGGLR